MILFQAARDNYVRLDGDSANDGAIVERELARKRVPAVSDDGRRAFYERLLRSALEQLGVFADGKWIDSVAGVKPDNIVAAALYNCEPRARCFSAHGGYSETFASIAKGAH